MTKWELTQELVKLTKGATFGWTKRELKEMVIKLKFYMTAVKKSLKSLMNILLLKKGDEVTIYIKP